MGGPGLHAFGVVFGALLQVPAGTERAASAGDDGYEGLWVAVELRNSVGQFASKLAVYGVQSVGAVQGHYDDVIALFVKDCLSQVGMLPRIVSCYLGRVG